MTDQDLVENVVSEPPWYKDGLRFQCTECGKVCMDN